MIVVASADAALLAGWTRAVEPMGDTVTVSDAHVLGATLGHFPRVTLMVDVRMLDAQPARRLLSLLDPHPSLQVMVMADRLDEKVRGFELGADDYLTKPFQMRELVVRLRALVSASDSARTFDLRCAVREQLVAFIQEHYPGCLPKTRAVTLGPDPALVPVPEA